LVGAALALVGLGLGMFQVPNLAQIMAAFPARQQGAAGGFAFLSRTAGVGTGVPIAAWLFCARGPPLGVLPALCLPVHRRGGRWPWGPLPRCCRSCRSWKMRSQARPGARHEPLPLDHHGLCLLGFMPARGMMLIGSLLIPVLVGKILDVSGSFSAAFIACAG